MRSPLLITAICVSLLAVTGCSSYNTTLVKTVEEAEQVAGTKTPQSGITGLPGEARIVKHLVAENAGAITVTVTIQNVSTTADTYQVEAATISGLKANGTVTLPAGTSGDVVLSIPGAFDTEATIWVHGGLLGPNVAVETIPLH